MSKDQLVIFTDEPYLPTRDINSFSGFLHLLTLQLAEQEINDDQFELVFWTAKQLLTALIKGDEKPKVVLDRTLIYDPKLSNFIHCS